MPGTTDDASRLWRPVDGSSRRTLRALAKRIAAAPLDASRPAELVGLVPLGHAVRSWEHPAFGAVLMLRSGRIAVTAANASGDRRTVGFADLDGDGRIRAGVTLRRWARAAGRCAEAALVCELEHRVVLAARPLRSRSSAARARGGRRG